MNFKINLNKVIGIELKPKGGKYLSPEQIYEINRIYSVDRSFIYDMIEKGYIFIWVEEYHGSHRLVGFIEKSRPEIPYKFSNNISKETIDKIFSIGSIPTKLVYEKKKRIRSNSKPTPSRKPQPNKIKVEKKEVFLSIDSILDKISLSGISSLNESEINFLNESSRNI